MSSSEPVKRRPGRPRKNPLPESPSKPELPAEPDPAAKALDEPKPPVEVEPEPVVDEKPRPSDPSDERIGQQLDDPAWRHISFADGFEYRIEDGVIVERVR